MGFEKLNGDSFTVKGRVQEKQTKFEWFQISRRIFKRMYAPFFLKWGHASDLIRPWMIVGKTDHQVLRGILCSECRIARFCDQRTVVCRMVSSLVCLRHGFVMGRS